MSGCVIFRFTLQILFLSATLFTLWLTDLIILNTLFLLFLAFLIVFVISPLFFKFSSYIQKHIIFLNFVQWPNTAYLNEPEKFGLKGVRNFYIDYHSNVSNDEIRLGVWHALPESYQSLSQKFNDTDEFSKDDVFNSLLAKGDHPIILYAHGNAYSRSAAHRRELYEILQKLDYHVIAFDYGGYGDSTGSDISELRVVEDTIMVYKWILQKLQSETPLTNKLVPIYIWGHSLGTGISVHTISVIASEISSPATNATKMYNLRQPNGIILESPFNNLADELGLHPLGRIYSWLPWFDWMVIQAIEDGKTTFKSDKYISYISSPILILHAKDDFIVPYELGVKLYNSAIISRFPDYGKVEFRSFNSSEGFGHKYICRSNVISDLISGFVDKYLTYQPLRLRQTDEELISPEEKRMMLQNKFL